MKAYKVFDENWKCRDMQYKVGKEFTYDGDITLGAAGFHACLKLLDCFSYYPFSDEYKVAEVKCSGNIIKANVGSKIVTNRMLIVRELPWAEVLSRANTGHHNTGNCNSGHHNTGNYNTGNYNTGNYNSGHHNSGNCNSGNYNRGHCNRGHFNTIATANMFVFNKPCTLAEWNKSNLPKLLRFSLTARVLADDATEEEQKTTGGFLKILTYQEAFQLSYENAPNEDRAKLKKLPNWDADVFFEISGIRVK